MNPILIVIIFFIAWALFWTVLLPALDRKLESKDVDTQRKSDYFVTRHGVVVDENCRPVSLPPRYLQK